MTAWLYEYAKKHMSKHSRVYSAYQLVIGSGAFKRAFVTHRNAVSTAVKKMSRTSDCDGRDLKEMLKEDMERNVTLCIHNSFYRNRETSLDLLPCCKQRVEEQKCWRTASNRVRMATHVLQGTETEMCRSRYPVHFVAADVKSKRTIVDQAFSVPKCVRLARMSEKLYKLLCKLFAAVPGRTKNELEPILGKKFVGYSSGNFSDFERNKQRGSTATDYNAVDENDEIHRVIMEMEPLLEASGKRNWRSIMLTHDLLPCPCLLQTWWYPGRSNLVLIWDSRELISMG